MKRALGLIIVIGIIIAGFFSVRGAMPFMPVFGTSMEPVLKTGNLILIEEVSPSSVKVGDIIAYNVPGAIREHYNYPPVVAHRVIKINTEHGISFRTKGDNTGEDPFTIRASDLKGKIKDQIPYLGLPLLFLQSQQGLIFVITALSLFALYLYSNELGRGRRKVQKGIFSPIIEENRQTRQMIAKSTEATEKGMQGTQQALNSFAQAVEVYAQHLKSHTSAIQGLSEASQELKKGAVEQNKVLTHLVEFMGQPKPKTVEFVEQPRPKIEQVTPKVVEKVQFPPGCYRSRRQQAKESEIFRAG